MCVCAYVCTLPGPGAVRRDGGADRHRPVGERRVPMATAVVQEEADPDPALVPGGDVEGQGGLRVEPHRSPTQREASSSLSSLLLITAAIITPTVPYSIQSA